MALEARGKCCGSGCRHCPYGHENVRDKARKAQQPVFLHRRRAEAPPPTAAAASAGPDGEGAPPRRDVLFFSSGEGLGRP